METYLFKQIEEGNLDFNGVEQIIWRASLSLFQHLMEKILLDEVLKLEQCKAISPGLLKLAMLWATKGTSYRDARDRLSDLYRMQVLSHEAIRRAL
jgi:hypothetical protein